LLFGRGRRRRRNRPLARALSSLLLETDNVAVKIAAADRVE
jgi:hypothetical protein